MVTEDICFKLDNVFLTTEQILVTFDIPIFFICMGSNNKRYTVLCTDSEKSTYVIVESDTWDILNMLQSKIKMVELFYKKRLCYIVKAGEDISSDIVETRSTNQLSPDELPNDDAYFELETPAIIKYVEKLSMETTLTNNFISESKENILFFTHLQTNSIVIQANISKPKNNYVKTLYSVEKISLWENYNELVYFTNKDCFGQSEYNNKVVMTHVP